MEPDNAPDPWFDWTGSTAEELANALFGKRPAPLLTGAGQSPEGDDTPPVGYARGDKP